MKCPYCNKEFTSESDDELCGWPEDKEMPKGYPPCWADVKEEC